MATSAWKKWYQENREAYNAARKKRRDSDPDLREKLAAAQRERRAKQPRPDKDEPRYKIINKQQVAVFRIGYVAKACHRSEQIIRIWEREGKIPKPSVPGGHRYYTQNQLNLLIEFSELLDEVRYDPKVRSVAVDHKVAEIKANWHN